MFFKLIRRNEKSYLSNVRCMGNAQAQREKDLWARVFKPYSPLTFHLDKLNVPGDLRVPDVDR